MATPETAHKVVTFPGWPWFKVGVKQKKPAILGGFEQGGEVVH